MRKNEMFLKVNFATSKQVVKIDTKNQVADMATKILSLITTMQFSAHVLLVILDRIVITILFLRLRIGT